MKRSKKYLGSESYIIDIELFSEKKEHHWIRLSVSQSNFYYMRYFWKETEEPEIKKTSDIQSLFDEILEDCSEGSKDAKRIHELIKHAARYLPPIIKKRINNLKLPEEPNPFIESAFTFEDLDQFSNFE